MTTGPAWRPPVGRLGAVAPVPFVGVATILVALIIFTPVLLATGPSPLAVQAELVIYRLPGATTTEFDIHAIGAAVPYSSIRIGLGTGFSWDGSCPSTKLNWTVSNQTNQLTLSVNENVTPVVVNATAVYGQGSTRTVYAAELALQVIGRGQPGESLAIAVCPSTSAVSVQSSVAVSNLPLALLLVNYGSGGP